MCRAGTVPGGKCETKFPRPEVDRVPHLRSEPGNPAALSPAPAAARGQPPGAEAEAGAEAWAGLGSRGPRPGRGWRPGPPLAPAVSAQPAAGGGPGSGRAPGRPAARGSARGLSPGVGEFWESPAQGGGSAAARAAVRAACRALRARSEGAAPGGGAHDDAGPGGRGGGGGGGGRRAPGSVSRALARLCALLSSAPLLTHGSEDTRRR